MLKPVSHVTMLTTVCIGTLKPQCTVKNSFSGKPVQHSDLSTIKYRM